MVGFDDDLVDRAEHAVAVGQKVVFRALDIDLEQFDRAALQQVAEANRRQGHDIAPALGDEAGIVVGSDELHPPVVNPNRLGMGHNVGDLEGGQIALEVSGDFGVRLIGVDGGAWNIGREEHRGHADMGAAIDDQRVRHRAFEIVGLVAENLQALEIKAVQVGVADDVAVDLQLAGDPPRIGGQRLREVVDDIGKAAAIGDAENGRVGRRGLAAGLGRRIGGQPLEQRPVAAGLDGLGELPFGVGTAGLPHPGEARQVGQAGAQCRSQGNAVAGRGEKAGFALDDMVGHAADGKAGHRRSRGEGFKDDVGQIVLKRRQHDQIRRGIKTVEHGLIGDVAGVDVADGLGKRRRVAADGQDQKVGNVLNGRERRDQIFAALARIGQNMGDEQ